MSTVNTVTEASVAANDELEPSASGDYDYSESINDDDGKSDEGLRAPIPIHDDIEDTSLLSDNELEAFVKTKNYSGKLSSIPPNLLFIYQRLSGKSKWDSNTYKQSQTTTEKSKMPREEQHSMIETPTVLPQIHSTPLLQEMSYSEDYDKQNNLETSPFGQVMTPAPSQPNILESIDSDDEILRANTDVNRKENVSRKQTLPLPDSPTTAPNTSLIANNMSSSTKIAFKDKIKDEKDDNKEEFKEEAAISEPVKECTISELMQCVQSLTSEVISLQQQLYVKDIMVKNLYLRLNEFNHISFPQLLIERAHIISSSASKYHHKHSKDKNGKKVKRTTLSEESISTSKEYINVNSSSSFKHHSTVTLEVSTRWLSRSNLSSAVKKGLVFLQDQDINDVDDYLSHQMYNDWQDSMKKCSISGLDKMKREEAHKQLTKYMQHERVGLVRIEILRGKKYKKYKRIEKRFESLIFRINDVPKGDTYHIMMKVHNPSASVWGPLSNMISIKVPLRFVDDNDTDNEDNKKNDKKSNVDNDSNKKKKSKTKK